ncbi:MAG: orotate phosphoribosyltransferase [Chromatiaceae bacterium]|nr:MAG: orotate phosphoribosyltransferase [Chromatiaceae bacterium]
MQPYQREFLRFAIATGVLRLGRFTLKSGRESPYFFNAGGFDHGASLARLGRFYAAALVAAGIECDMLYGPAYKGIVLAAATAIALADQHDRDLPYAFNRKEAKDHGEGGTIVGSPLAGRVLIIDDVITAGGSVSESVAIIEAAGANPSAVLIALDRREVGADGHSAAAGIRARHGLPVFSIASIDELIDYLAEIDTPAAVIADLQAYRARYGAP